MDNHKFSISLFNRKFLAEVMPGILYQVSNGLIPLYSYAKLINIEVICSLIKWMTTPYKIV